MAGTVKGITIEFRGETTKLDKAIKGIDKETRSLDRDLKDVDRALKFNPKNTELLAQKQQLLGQRIQQTKTKLQTLKQAQKQLDDDPSVDKTSQEYMNLRRQIITTESKLKHFNSELQKTKYTNITNLGNAFKSAGQKMRTAGMYVSGAAAGAIITGKKLLELNATQEQAETKLIEIYKKRMGVNEKAAKSTMEVATALQKQGVIGDEVTLSGAQQLATYAKYPATVNKLLPAMDNLLVQQKGLNATADDATSVANLFGKAMTGQTGALKKVGISFTDAQEEVLKYGTEEEKAATLADVVTQNVGDMNKKFAETDAGKIQQAKNTLGDFGEQLGSLLLPALAGIADTLTKKVFPVIEKIIGYLQEHPVIAKIAVGITAFLAVAGPLLIIVGAIASGIGAIMTVIPMLGGAFAALAGPVGIAIAIIGGLIAIGVILYKNWDKIKAKAAELKDNIVKKFTALKIAVKVIFNHIKDAMLAPIRKAVEVIKGMIKKIKDFFNFKVHLPKIKLPHFSIDPPGWKLADLLHGEIPSLGIKWYKQGGIFDSPSVIGVGEAGPEAVLPIEKLNGMLNSMANNIVNGIGATLALQGAGMGGEVKIINYLYPNGPKMGEETVKMYDLYKGRLG